MILNFIIIILVIAVGGILGLLAPAIPYTYSKYLAVAIVAALDSVLGGVTASLKGKFDMKVFVTGFIGNGIFAMCLTILGEKLNVDILIACVVVFVGRMINNLGTIRRFYLDKIIKKKQDIEKR